MLLLVVDERSEINHWSNATPIEKPRLLAIGYHQFIHPMACLISISASCYGVLLDLNQNQIAGLIHG